MTAETGSSSTVKLPRWPCSVWRRRQCQVAKMPQISQYQYQEEHKNTYVDYMLHIRTFKSNMYETHAEYIRDDR